MSKPDGNSQEPDGPCSDCGLNYVRGYAADERYHRKAHDEAVNGSKTRLSDGFHILTHESPISEQRLVQKAASAARDETRYDFTTFYATKKKYDPHNTVAVLSVREGRVCGLVVTRERDCEYTARLESFRPDEFGWRPSEHAKVDPHRRRAVDMIWVLRKNRRHGLAREMIGELTGFLGLGRDEIAHMIPFKEDAVRLWQGLGLSTIYIV